MDNSVKLFLSYPDSQSVIQYVIQSTSKKSNLVCTTEKFIFQVHLFLEVTILFKFLQRQLKDYKATYWCIRTASLNVKTFAGSFFLPLGALPFFPLPFFFGPIFFVFLYVTLLFFYSFNVSSLKRRF